MQSLKHPAKLRDFGGAWFPTPAAARTRIARLLRFYRPSVLVLAGAGTRYPRNTKIRKSVTRIALSEARKLTLPVSRISEKEFQSFLNRHSCRDKYDMAPVLALHFPELAWRLPGQLKFYETEPSSMLYFDSIALGMAYLELTHK
jgi:hypothetical protein